MPYLKRPAATSFGVSPRIQTAISNGYVFPSLQYFSSICLLLNQVQENMKVQLFLWSDVVCFCVKLMSEILVFAGEASHGESERKFTNSGLHWQRVEGSFLSPFAIDISKEDSPGHEIEGTSTQEFFLPNLNSILQVYVMNVDTIGVAV